MYLARKTFSDEMVLSPKVFFFFIKRIVGKGVNTVLEAVPVWLAVRYISDTGQYWCTVSGLLLFFIFINIYIYIYICVYIYYNKYKSLL